MDVTGNLKRNLRSTTVKNTLKAKSTFTGNEGMIMSTASMTASTIASSFLNSTNKMDHHQMEQNVSISNLIPSLKRTIKQEWEDLDAEDADDPLMISEYVVEIFEYMRELEV